MILQNSFFFLQMKINNSDWLIDEKWVKDEVILLFPIKIHKKNKCSFTQTQQNHKNQKISYEMHPELK